MEIAFIVLMFVCGVIGSAITISKGRSGMLGAVLGCALNLLGLIIVILIPRKEPADTYACPACGEQVKIVAKICKHCKTQLV